jgi:hypothetical protein
MSRLSFAFDLAKGVLGNIFKGAAKGADEVAPVVRRESNQGIEAAQEAAEGGLKVTDRRAASGFRQQADEVVTPPLVHPTTGRPLTSSNSAAPMTNSDPSLAAGFNQRGLIPTLLHHSGITTLFQIPWVAKTALGAVALTGAFVINPLDKSSTGGVINGTIPNLMGSGAIPMFVPLNLVQNNAAFVEGQKTLAQMNASRESEEKILTEAQAGQQTQARALEYERAWTILQNGTPEQKSQLITRISMETGVGKNELVSEHPDTPQNIYQRLFSVRDASPELLAYQKRFALSLGVQTENPGIGDIQQRITEIAQRRAEQIQRDFEVRQNQARFGSPNPGP